MEDTSKMVTKIKEMQAKSERRLKDRERELRLMNAGLKELPLERDFLEMQRREFEHDRSFHELGSRLLGGLSEMNANL